MEQSTSSPLARGVLVADRYRLEQVRDERQLPDGRRVALWRAVDTSLDRRIAILVTTARTKKARKLIADAATRAGRVSDGRFVRVLDVGDLDDAATWVATEWVEAPSLTAVLRREPLDSPVATELVRQVAEALAAAARTGCRHGRLHPDEVLLPDGGTPRVTGLEVAAALADATPTAADDVRGIGALLYAAVTGSWPLPGWQGLPRPARGDGLHPRAQRREVSREVDEITARALRGDYGDVDAIAKALRRLPTRAIDAPVPQRVSRVAALARRWAWRVVPPMLVATIAVAAWQVGSDLGRVPSTARTHHAALPPTTTTAPGTGQVTLVWSSPPTVTSFDPEGDGQENQDTTGFAVDRDSSTTWTTDLYRTAHFGALKSGVGLLLDLGRPTSVSEADLALSVAGSDAELRAGDQLPHAASDLRLVTTGTDLGTQVTWKLPRPVTARYWLIWFTNLPKVNGGYRIGVTDLALLGRGAG